MQTLDVVSGATLSYAQNFEDIALESFFGSNTTGFYVDVGANDPDVDSVTKIFYQRGWRGINIEPITFHYEQLLHQRPEDINLNIGVSNTATELTLREYEGTGLSTLSTQMQKLHAVRSSKLTSRHKDYKIQTKTLKQIFKDHHVSNINFMKVDVEGFEYEVLSSNDWNLYRPEVVCVESTHIEHDWRPILVKNGYKLAFFDGLNDYYIDLDKLKAGKIRDSDYADAVLARRPIVDNLLTKYIDAWVDRVNAQQSNNEKTIQRLTHNIALAQGEATRVRAQYDEISSLMRHIKKFVRSKIQSKHHKIIDFLSHNKPYVPVALRTLEGSRELLKVTRRTDRENYENFTRQPKRGVLLRVYLFLCRVAHGAWKKVR